MFPILHECLLEDQLQVAKTFRKYKHNILKAAYISKIISNVKDVTISEILFKSSRSLRFLYKLS